MEVIWENFEGEGKYETIRSHWYKKLEFSCEYSFFIHLPFFLKIAETKTFRICDSRVA